MHTDLQISSCWEQYFELKQYAHRFFHLGVHVPFYQYHIRIIAKKNWFTRHETDRFLNNQCQECVRAYLSIHDCLSFLHEVMIGNHWTKTFLHEVMIGNHRNKTTES